jgi:hypothetical protein
MTVLLAFARHHRMRRWLNGRVLALVRTDLVDACGRTLASHVTPILVELKAPLSRANGRAAFVALWQDVERQVLCLSNPDRDRWMTESLRLYTRFRETRTARERAIWQAVARNRAPALQPGLFDHRTLRDHRVWSHQHEEAIEDATRRVDASLRLTGPHVTPPRVVLMLA